MVKIKVKEKIKKEIQNKLKGYFKVKGLADENCQTKDYVGNKEIHEPKTQKLSHLWRGSILSRFFLSETDFSVKYFFLKVDALFN